MLRGIFAQSFSAALVTTILIVSLLNISSAQVRTSSSYQLQSDSINVGGGFSTSTSYRQESTVGEVATGRSTSTSYQLLAGYQQMQEVYLSLSITGDVTMTPNIYGLTGGTSNGSTTVTVTTDSPSGYQLTIEAENNPAMQSTNDTIADYDDGGVPDLSFDTSTTGAHFGFTPEGMDIVQAYKDDGGSCNVDVQDTASACWDGLSTSPTTIAQKGGSNHPDGATTTIRFRVWVGSSAGLTAGVYTSTTTVTALPL
ncbi:MAG: hypothetical protein KC877_00300 [Candidatus Kaiserbacteria bacterium]|nr:hypothetical protein [Candidatus Kaiserbacteria bacterium]MCB9816267.1 hypothetical protein [Candidatus Nomurabacteria bacterium]